MIVSHKIVVDVGLSERAVDAERCSAQPQGAVGSRRVDGVDQFRVGVVHVRCMQHGRGDDRRCGTFGNGCTRIGR